METIFVEEELPVADLQKLGLFRDGKILLEPDAVQALLSGRRTELIGLSNLQADGFVIERLDAKLSLDRSPDGIVVVKAHPIYKDAQPHPQLNEHEAAVLSEKGLASIRKVYGNPPGKSATYVIEYDPETKEFVSYRPEQVKAPEKVNGEKLTDKQKEDFRNGDLVTLSDGTRFQHRASVSKGILSDRKALVLSVLLDGGISYLLITGIRNLIGANTPQKEAYTKGYKEALEDMQRHQRSTGELQAQQLADENHKRGYSRGSSR
ncbi:Protein of unknown function [Mucilaginibacter pineti]|uniref:DUF4099 domain-containing protein n=1 Tax=Mucilaginibacter pineti TaxID=1391627 RepID=A0A1G7A9L5_9SPHI|nr:DUF4099 domain-containing protein [Mucilaginibacter pineti]SDE11177.1 Protein of unknown function [Mucilaginibacter pineti]